MSPTTQLDYSIPRGLVAIHPWSVFLGLSDNCAGFIGGGGGWTVFDILDLALTPTGTRDDGGCPAGDCADPNIYGNIGLLSLIQDPLRGGQSGGGTPQRIKDIINNALKQLKLSECLNKLIGPGMVLTNANLPYVNGTQSSAQLAIL